MTFADQLPLIGEYDDAQINLEGDAEGLRLLADVLRDGLPEQHHALFIPNDPTEWNGYLDCIRVYLLSEPFVTITREDDCLIVIGNLDGLSKIARAVDYVANANVKGRIHIEYPAWEIISSSSDALVISCSG